MPSLATPQLLSSAVMQLRISSFHRLFESASLGMLPPGHPACSRECRCSAALHFLRLSLGWLLPVYLAARGQQRRAAAQHAGHAQRAGRAPGSPRLANSLPLKPSLSCRWGRPPSVTCWPAGC